MSAGWDEQVEELFRAVAAASPEQREDLIERSGFDHSVRDEVRSLLAHVDRPAPALDGLGARIADMLEEVLGAPEPDDGEVPEVIGPFRIVRELGRGGMGAVYLAEQEQPLRRRVALKLNRRTDLGPRELARFGVEQQVLAGMSHPGIAAIHDAGVAAGRPYFTMEYVDGAPITQHCAQGRLSFRARLELVLAVCEAVSHAHRRGCVHRDLKPSNILVTPEGVAKVIDFGLAEWRDDAGGPSPEAAPERRGTVPYMSPEQIDGRTPVDTRTDIHALGVTLYEVLVGANPFAVRGGTSATTYRERILAGAMRPLSDGLRDADSTYSRRELRDVAPEVGWIIARATLPDADRRYQTVDALALDLRSALAGRPVAAAPPARRVRLRRWAWHHRARIAVGAALGLASLLGVAAWVRAGWAEHRSATLQLIGEMEHLWQRETPGLIRDDRRAARVAAAEAFVRRARGLGLTDDSALVRDLAGPGGMLERERRRLALFAREREVTLGASAGAWRTAAAAVAADPVYAGLRLEPQLGLVPLGRDPASGLQEFAHWLSGEVPTRGADGALVYPETAGIVLVLIPGGEALVGAQSEAPATEGYDVEAFPEEAPPCRVRLDAFFLAKHEATQWQWQVLTEGGVPSVWRAGNTDLGCEVTWRHPVESISWDEADRVARSVGLALPTEAQWEYAARAGTLWPWFTGAEKRALKGSANIADLSTVGTNLRVHYFQDWLDDGYPFHAPVGSYAPNPWGLYDVLGNVGEWTLEPFGPYGAFAPGDGARSGYPEHALLRIQRGGSWANNAPYVRVSHRQFLRRDHHDGATGVRLARPIES